MFLIFNFVLCEAAEIFQKSFQEPATSEMDGIYLFNSLLLLVYFGLMLPCFVKSALKFQFISKILILFFKIIILLYFIKIFLNFTFLENETVMLFGLKQIFLNIDFLLVCK